MGAGVDSTGSGRAARVRHGGRRAASRARVHPAWRRFIVFCEELGHGEIAALKIQDGLPVLAEVTTKKIKFG